MEEREKATIEQLYEQLGNNFDITICSDIVNGLYFEYKQLYYENEQLKEQLELSEKARKEAIEFLFIVYGISADYDGFNDAAGLKAVIDDIARYAKQAKKVLDIDKGEMKDE